MSDSGAPAPEVAVVGATGVVGTQIVELLEARGFNCARPRLFAGAAGAVTTVEVAGKAELVERLKSPATQLADFDIAFLALPRAEAEPIIAMRPGPFLIDLSAAAESPSAATLFAPGHTPRELIGASASARLFPIAHPAAQVLATVLRALDPRDGFAVALLLEGASAGGGPAISRLVAQSTDLVSGGLSLTEGEPQRAFNLFRPAGKSGFAQALIGQVGRLLGSAPRVMLDVVETPVLHGSALWVGVAGGGGEVFGWPERLRGAPGLLLVEEEEPLGVIDAVAQEAALVRVQATSAGAVLWCVFDAARLAALAAVWVAENLPLTPVSRRN